MKGKRFNAQEVQAIIAGNKTMFREVIKKTEEKFEANPFVWVVDFKINK